MLLEPPPPLSLLEREWHGITGLQWMVAAVIVSAGTTLLVLLRTMILGRVRAWAARTQGDFDDFLATLIERTRSWFFVLLMLRAATLVLDLSERWDQRVQTLLIVGGMIQGGLWASALVRYLVDRRFANHIRPADHSPQVTPVAQTLLRFAGLLLVWSIVMLAVLSAFGIDITALVAGLGIGGVAVALAVQRVLGDVLASISIAVDKPFSPGDSIAVGDQQGTVRRIGMRSTILAGINGEELVFANNDLLSSRIRNFTRMSERRVNFKLRIVLDTPQALIEALPALLREVVDGRDKVRLDRAVLAAVADAWLEYEIVYWVTDPGYAVFAAIHQQVLFDLLRRMREAGYNLARGAAGDTAFKLAEDDTPAPSPLESLAAQVAGAPQRAAASPAATSTPAAAETRPRDPVGRSTTGPGG